ncbi:MAG: glycosyltransferase, partial [Calditrichaeota bacterium]
SEFSNSNLPTVAVIVAARNEEHNLPRLLHHLQQLDYPREKLEICIVDDRSTDNSAPILQSAREDMPNLKVLHVRNQIKDFAPKKRALDMAIRATRGEIIMLTDADCSPPPTWIREMLACYKEESAGVIGYSPYRFDKPMPKMLRKMLSLEFFSVAAVAAASVGLGTPATAAGCNLSYRRQTYLRAKGFEGIRHWVSGDDDLFILKVAEMKIGTWSYGLSPEAFVPAAAPSTWRAFWNQRIRYAGKGAHYALPFVTALVAVYLFNVMLATSVPALFAGFTTFANVTIVAWLVKSLFEWRFLYTASKSYKNSHLLTWYIPTALLHPFYITIFGFMGTFSRFTWRGDEFAITTEELNHG